MRNLFGVLKIAVSDFFRDDVISLAAALAFFTILSLAPLIIILISVTGLIGIDAQQHLIEQVGIVAGPGARSAIELVIEDASARHITGKISALASIIFFLYCSTFVFAQLTKSLNRIWGAGNEAHPLKKLLRESLLSLCMVIVLIILFLASIVAHTTTSLMFSGFKFNWQIIHFLISLIIFMLIFATIFKFLPSVRVAWKDTWIGSFITALLVVIGNLAIGKYLKHSSIASAYGAAGSLVMLLIWIYYCSIIVFLGAEIMQANFRNLPENKLPPKYFN